MLPVFKPRFIERYQQLTDWPEFEKSCLSYLKRSIRVNTLKISVKELKERLSWQWKLEEIPWIKEGFWVEHKEGRRDIGNTLEHALGYFYVQEAASMIPPLVLKPKKNDLVLDLSAAPGSKTTQLAAMMKNSGLIIANDIKGERISALGINLQRCGVTNTVITKFPGQRFPDFLFDKILVDAPCSATGTIMRSWKTLRIWNPKMVTHLSFLQKKIISRAFELLKPKGTLVYSTCSLEPEEDEGVIDFLLNNYQEARLEKIEIKNLKKSPLILEFGKNKYSKKINKCLRIWPQDNNTEGFFVAKIRKD